MAKKVHKLKDNTSENYSIIAISSHQSDYRLSWALNEILGLQLQRTEDHTVPVIKDNIEQKFTHYAFEQSEAFVSYHLIANKSEKGYLLKNYDNIDYFLKISGELENISLSNLVRKMKQIPMVITAFELDKLNAAQKRRLTF